MGPVPVVRVYNNMLLSCQPGERLQSSRSELARQLDVVETADTLKLPLLCTVVQQSRTAADGQHGNQQRHSLTEVSLSVTAVIVWYAAVVGLRLDSVRRVCVCV